MFSLLRWPTLLRTTKNSCVVPESETPENLCARAQSQTDFDVGKNTFLGILCVQVVFPTSRKSRKSWFREGKLSSTTCRKSYITFSFCAHVVVVEVGNENNLSLYMNWCYFPTEITHTQTHTKSQTQSHFPREIYVEDIFEVIFFLGSRRMNFNWVTLLFLDSSRICSSYAARIGVAPCLELDGKRSKLISLKYSRKFECWLIARKLFFMTEEIIIYVNLCSFVT